MEAGCVNTEIKFGYHKCGSFLACVNNYYFLKSFLLVGLVVSLSVSQEVQSDVSRNVAYKYNLTVKMTYGALKVYFFTPLRQ
jgi:hypothetical protein